MAPKPEIVRLLVDTMLHSLETIDGGYTVSELMSAAFTVTDSLVASIADVPGVNLEPIREMLATMYARLPRETVN